MLEWAELTPTSWDGRCLHRHAFKAMRSVLASMPDHTAVKSPFGDVVAVGSIRINLVNILMCLSLSRLRLVFFKSVVLPRHVFIYQGILKRRAYVTMFTPDIIS